LLFTVFPFILHQTLFWGYSLLLLLVDLYRPAALYRYKLQRYELERDKLFSCMLRCLLTQCFVMVPTSLLLNPLHSRLITELRISELPTLVQLLQHFFVCSVVEELGFYFTHRALHHPLLYTRIHKIHHDFVAPIGMAAEYAHPLEFLFSNYLPLVIGPLLCRSHLLFIYVWYTIAVFTTVTHHSGYAFPFFLGHFDPRPHDYHHYSFTKNFGVSMVLDRMLGTYGSYSKEYLQKRRLL